MADPTILSGNPYLSGRFGLSPDQLEELKWGSLGSSLVGIGAGISQAGASGQPWLAGVAPGAVMATNQMNAQRKGMQDRNAAQAQFEQMESYRKAQEEGLRTTNELKKREMDREEALMGPMMGALSALNGGGATAAPTGFNVQPPAVQMGPDAIRNGQSKVDYLTQNYKLSPVAASGIVGGLYQESGFDPGYGFTRPGGDKGTAYGMGQWRKDRAEGLIAYAAERRLPPTDETVQLDYLMKEMKGGDMGAQRAYAMLQQSKTPEQATAAMMHFFRPAGYTPANPTAGHGYAQRVQYAQKLMPGGGGGEPGQPVIAQGSDMPAGDGSGNPPRPPQPVGTGLPGAPPNYVPVVPGPSRADPRIFMPGLMSPRLKPLASAGIDLINRQNENYFKQQGLERDFRSDDDKRGQFEREQGLKEKNSPVTPGGVVNQPVVDAEVAKATAIEKAKREAEMDTHAATTLVTKAVGDFVEKERPKALAIQATIPQIHNVRRLIDAGALTGTGASMRNTLAQIGSTFGIQSDAAELTPSYMAALAQQIVANAKALGVNPTDRDAIIIKDAQGANPDISKQGMLKLLDVQEGLQRQAHARYLEEAKRIQGLRGVKAAYGDDYFTLPEPPKYGDWLKANPLPTSPPPSNRPPLNSILGGNGNGNFTPMTQGGRPSLGSILGGQ